MATALKLNSDFEMIERMELDLVSKAQTAFTAAGLTANIHGVFSLDDLEAKEESDLCNMLAVGVGYAGAETYDTQRSNLNTAPGGPAVKNVDFAFAVILAVPHGVDCAERYSATKLLTVLRLGIIGSIVSGDIASRTWAFVREFPNIQDSTDSMLYYTQMWKVNLPQRGAGA